MAKELATSIIDVDAPIVKAITSNDSDNAG